MNTTNLQQALQEARERAEQAERARVEAETQAKLFGVLARVAQADVKATQAVVDVKETEATWRKAGENEAIASEAKTKAEAGKTEAEKKLVQAKADFKVAEASEVQAKDILVAAAKVAQAMAIAKADADKDLAVARAELEKIQPLAPAPEPTPVPVLDSVPAKAHVGFWAKLFGGQSTVKCPSCGQMTPQGPFCVNCSGALGGVA